MHRWSARSFRCWNPFQCAAPEPLNQQPVIKTLLAVLQLELEDWPFDRLYAVLNSGWFRPPLAGWSVEQTPRVAASVLRRARIPGNRSAILATLERLDRSGGTASDAAEGAETKDQSRILAGRCLNRLSEALQPLRQKRDARSWAEALIQVARELGIAPQSVEADGQEAIDAWQAFEELLFIAAGTEELLGLGRRRSNCRSCMVNSSTCCSINRSQPSRGSRVPSRSWKRPRCAVSISPTCFSGGWPNQVFRSGGAILPLYRSRPSRAQRTRPVTRATYCSNAGRNAVVLQHRHACEKDADAELSRGESERPAPRRTFLPDMHCASCSIPRR